MGVSTVNSGIDYLYGLNSDVTDPAQIAAALAFFNFFLTPKIGTQIAETIELPDTQGAHTNVPIQEEIIQQSTNDAPEWYQFDQLTNLWNYSLVHISAMLLGNITPKQYQPPPRPRSSEVAPPATACTGLGRAPGRAVALLQSGRTPSVSLSRARSPRARPGRPARGRQHKAGRDGGDDGVRRRTPRARTWRRGPDATAATRGAGGAFLLPALLLFGLVFAVPIIGSLRSA